MIAGVRLAAHAAIDPGFDQARAQVGRQQDLVEPQAGVALPALPHVVPERVHRRVRMERADGVDPALCKQALIGGAALRLQQRVIVIGFGLIDVLRRRHDVVVAREHDRDAGLVERRGVARQPLEPGELVVEFRPRLRVAVRRIERGDQHAVDRGLDIAALFVVGIARQFGAGDDRHHAARQDRDAVPGLLAAPHRLVAGLAQRIGGKLAVGGFQFLQAGDVGLGAAQPARPGSAAACGHC